MKKQKDSEQLLQEVSTHNNYPINLLKDSLNKTYSDYYNDNKMGFFFRNFTPEKGDIIVDVGCFLGRYLFVLAEQYPDCTFIGYDIDSMYIEAAKSLFKRGNLTFLNEDILKSKIKPGTADHIFFFEVLEHVDHPKQFLNQFNSLLKKGGRLYLSTPAALGITNILFNVKNQNIRMIESQPRDTGTEMDHLYVWDKLTLYRLLNRSGFTDPLFRVSNKLSLFKGQSLTFIVKKAH